MSANYVFPMNCPGCARLRAVGWTAAGALLFMLLCNYGISRQRDQAKEDLEAVANAVRAQAREADEMRLTIDVLRRQLADRGEVSRGAAGDAEKRNP